MVAEEVLITRSRWHSSRNPHGFSRCSGPKNDRNDSAIPQPAHVSLNPKKKTKKKFLREYFRTTGSGHAFPIPKDKGSLLVDPLHEQQTKNNGELRAVLHAVCTRDHTKQTLVCPDSLLVVLGITRKAPKWQRHDWQGSGRPVSHVNLWTSLLEETARIGDPLAACACACASHPSIEGNTKAGLPAGRRPSALLNAHVTAPRALIDQQGNNLDTDAKSDFESPSLRTEPLGLGDHVSPLCVDQRTGGRQTTLLKWQQ